MHLRHRVGLVSALVISVQSIAADALSNDVVEGVAIAGILNREFKAECEFRFPELKESVRKAFDAAPINSVVVREYVGGREYRNPMIHSAIALKREMTAGGEYGAVKRADCENPEAVFSKSSREFLGMRERQDYEALLGWAAKGEPPTPEQMAPIDVDMKIVAAMQSRAFWEAYPREFVARGLSSINLVRYVQRAQFVALAIKSRCDDKWPDRRADHEDAYQAWPYGKIEALTIVNGRAYDNPYIVPAALHYWLPALFGSDEKSQEAACRDLRGTLEKVAKRAALDWFPQLLELLTVSR